MTTVTETQAPQRHSTGSVWEPKVGYCRAIKSGNIIAVSGCAPVAVGGGVHGPGDIYAQTQRCLVIIQEALRALGAGPAQVVRTRIFTTDISKWQDIGRAHAEVFGVHRPTTTMVEVRALIDKEMLVEIEADAVV